MKSDGTPAILDRTKMTDDATSLRKNLVRQASYYDRFVSAFDSMEAGSETSGNRLARQRFLAKKVALILGESRIHKTDVVVDVGCGTAILSKEAMSRAACVIAVDVSLGMLEVARKKCESECGYAEFIRADASSLPFADESVDKYISSNLIEHLSSIDKHFSEVYRVLAQGGKAVFCFPNGSTRFLRLEKLAEGFLRRYLVLKKEHRAFHESVDECASIAERYSELASVGASFVHNELDVIGVSHQLSRSGFRVASVRTFGIIPYLTPDILMLTRLPSFLERTVERLGLFHLDLGSALITVDKTAN